MTQKTRAIILHPYLRDNDYTLRQPEDYLGEATRLAEAIGLEAVHEEVVRITAPRPSTLLGQGRVEQIHEMLGDELEDVELAIIDSDLTPVQHRNLEKEWQVKVLDRTALILEIFGARAQTKEGTLQVELAHLIYQRSRLVRSWTHLERQRGGSGFLGGPGERQIESDRRILADKIVKLRRQLEDVRRTRNLQRRKRKRAPHPVAALVGYTNAGKSTLFNRLTDASVMAQDQLFATLDPTMRVVHLPSATEVIFSDTVGFISNLPTQLVAAFRATLEEVLEADIILHVRDAAHPESDAQKADVLAVLKELGIDEDYNRPVLEVWNKTDLLGTEEFADMRAIAKGRHENADGTIEDPWVVMVSAITGSGIEQLYDEIDRILTLDHIVFNAAIEHEQGAALAWLYAHGEVLETAQQKQHQLVTVRLSQKSAGQFAKQFGIELEEEGVSSLSQTA
ncbi:MAG: GTPase HflX [Aquisalinus sp.]|nr:GTPase HflX [Aquisalinus sp.]